MLARVSASESPPNFSSTARASTSATIVSATTLEVKAPGGEHGKLVDVVVKNPDGKTDMARRAFMYDSRYD